jgi:hypothetical protein
VGLSRAHSGPPPPSPYGRGRAQVGRGGEVGDYRILTPERVTLQYDIAGIGFILTLIKQFNARKFPI